MAIVPQAPADAHLIPVVVLVLTQFVFLPHMAESHQVDAGELSSVTGRVTLTDAHGTTFDGAGARLILNCKSRSIRRVAIADERGAFSFKDVPAQGCVIAGDLQGFKAGKVPVKAGRAGELALHLDVEPIFTGLTVKAAALPQVEKDE